MPRHLISDAHEWINEILTVPTYIPAKPQPRERAWRNRRGKKTLLSLTLVGRRETARRMQHRWEAPADLEIPPPPSLFFSFDGVGWGDAPLSGFSRDARPRRDPGSSRGARGASARGA